MTQELITGTAVFDDEGKQVGKVADTSDVDKVGIITETGSRFWVPTAMLTHRDQLWMLEPGYTEISPAEAKTQQAERELDEANAETFPASDPPSFTMGDEGKGG
ncbi:hypothetical protein HOP61_11555 [Halomonas daqingensis]|uniref:PRC-barrel domain-containing protein n=1 Tax=Billgrantia desiderata TaxID=52021 RepID=A0AAW4YU57_9GAMM|nr:hypothetical protein [Halomonas desiderata]MCE8051934.1 hypothetical protein [Halomonas desiderata]